MLRDIGITCGERDLSQQEAVLEGMTQMQTTSMHTPARRGGALVRTVRAVGRWFSRSVNALGKPSADGPMVRLAAVPAVLNSYLWRGRSRDDHVLLKCQN